MSSFDHRYDNLVDFFQTCPRLAIFRSFRYLYLTCLLQLQAEIVKCEMISQSPSNASSDSAQDASSASHPSEPDLQGDELLALGKQIHGLQIPEDCDITYLRITIESLFGETDDACPWSQEDDLVALFTSPNSESDRFTSWVFDKLVLFHKYAGKFMKSDIALPPGETAAYDEEAFASRITVISVIVAVIMNVSSIYILYYIDSMQTRLTVIMVYTSLFAMMMTLLTNSQGAHIWPATATYAAMLVVFIGNNNGN